MRRKVYFLEYKFALYSKHASLCLLFCLKAITFLPIVRNIYITLLVKALQNCKLFDREYYLASNPDVAESGKDPLLHYVAYGDEENRQPNILFDPKFYKQGAKNKLCNVNSLLHYLTVGRYKKISPSPWFDAEYYLSINRDVRLNKMEPLTHFIFYGGREGRSPNRQFDSEFYMSEYSDVSESGVNPLIHYIQFGRAEGRLTNSNQPYYVEDVVESKSRKNEFINVSVAGINPFQYKCRSVNEIAIIIPVYDQRKLTLRCLKSVLESKSEMDFDVVVVNDASTDNELIADLKKLNQLGWIKLINHKKNKGFVHSVNFGIEASGDKNVIILNSDTEVYDYWIDRLHSAAHSKKNIASVTPLSNNATICSYPIFLRDNPYPLEVSGRLIDEIASSVNKDKIIETPTGVGFCMYMTRHVIHCIGLFNTKLFGRGYGEENDWCQRAIKAGFQNLIAPNIYVSHFGGASFKGEKQKLIDKALEAVEKKHPSYQEQIQKFIADDPLYVARLNIDWERLRLQSKNKNALIVCHERGGGTARRIKEFEKELDESGFGVYYLKPVNNRKEYVRITNSICQKIPSSPSFKLDEYELLATKLSELKITAIYVHSLVDYKHEAPDYIAKLARYMKIPLNVEIHDYAMVCPRINLIDKSGMYCGEANEYECDKCLMINDNEFGVRDIAYWRKLNHKMLSFAQHIAAPSEDCKIRINRYFPDIKINVIPHLDERVTVRTNSVLPFTRIEKHIHIVVIGAISKMKGYDVLLECAKDAKRRNLKLKFTLMGYSLNDNLLRQQGVNVTGRYFDHDAEQLLVDLNPDYVWLPSLWPETYSYTLSIAFGAGYPVVAFNIGAIAERLKNNRKDDCLLPLEAARNPEAVNQYFLELKAA